MNVRPRTNPRSIALSIFVVASAFGAMASCGSSAHPAGLDSTEVPPPGASVPPSTTVTAPCTPGETRSCSIKLTKHDGVIDCITMTQTCRDGAWSECGDLIPACNGSDALDTPLALHPASGDALSAFWAEQGIAPTFLHVAGLVNRPARMVIGKDDGVGVAISDASSNATFTLEVDSSTRTLTASATGTFRVHVGTNRAAIDLPVDSVKLLTTLDENCKTLQQASVSLFIPVSAGSQPMGDVTVAERLGTPTTEGSAQGWWIRLTSANP